MDKKVKEIIEDVRICIDEIADNDASWIGSELGEGNDNSEMKTIIRQKIGEALLFVYGNARADIFEMNSISWSNASTAVSADSNGVIVAVLPDEYLRVLWVKLKSWRYPVYEIFDETSDDYAIATDPYAGANAERPAVLMGWKDVVVSGNNGSPDTIRTKRALEFWKSKEASDKYVIAYLPKKDVDVSDDEAVVALDNRLYNAIINYIAGLTLTTYGEKARADEFFEIAMVEMGVSKAE